MRVKLIKDPVHGYLGFDEELLGIIDLPSFQRLRRIIQLPFVYLVYPGARHTRFDHSLGCFYLAGLFAERLGLDEGRRRTLEVAALLHDLGHAPYSHLLETLLRERGLSHEEMTVKILREDGDTAEAVERAGVSVREVTDVLEKRVPEGWVISGPVDVDKLDFLVRDSYFTGASYGVVDTTRIIHTSRLVDGRLALSVRAIGVVEELALARYQSFMNIYFHHAVRAAQTLFLRGVRMLGEKFDLASMSVAEYLSHDDFTVWCLMRLDDRAREIVRRIERRILPKVAYEVKAVEGGGFPEWLTTPDAVREAEERIAEEAHVPRDHVWIDTPYVPPLPYLDQERIDFYSEEDGEIVLKRYDSPLLRFTAGVYKILRVYTEREYLERVRDVAERILTP